MSYREWRSVNGCGPRCGCGEMSRLHRMTDRQVLPETSVFLCSDCMDRALELLRAERPEQPPYWPGDEDRDEPYERPTEIPAHATTQEDR